ncbi:MAG: FHA domain-containing protein [Christensenellaceae bacterium]|jgi:hypothetical protein
MIISNAIFSALSVGMRYIFILIAGIMLFMIITISRREYKERRAALGEIQYYIGYLEIIAGVPDAIGVRIGITADNTVGSGRSADIVIDDKSVGRSHALLYRAGDMVVLAPLAKNETKINGRRATKAYQIYSGDVITFGNVEASVFLREEVAGYDDDATKKKR